MPPDEIVFLSHATEDAERVRGLCRILEERGVRCWMAPRDVPPAANYPGSIVGAIEHCAKLICFLSESANRSRFVAREVERAFSKHKRIITVRLADVTPHPELELFLSSEQWIDIFDGHSEDGVERLLTALRPKVDAGAMPRQPRLFTESGRRTRRDWLRVWLIALAVVALGVAIAVYVVGLLPADELDRTFGAGYRQFKFGMSPEQVAAYFNPAPPAGWPQWQTLPIASEYTTVEIRYLWKEFSSIRDLPPFGGSGQCISATSYAVFFFSSEKLFRVALRFINTQACSDYSGVLAQFAGTFRLKEHTGSAGLAFFQKGNRVTFSGTRQSYGVEVDFERAGGESWSGRVY